MIFLSADYDDYVNIIGISLAPTGSFTARMGYGDMPSYEWFSISASTDGHVVLVEVDSARSHVRDSLLRHVARTRTLPVIAEHQGARDELTLWLGMHPEGSDKTVAFAEEEDFEGELAGTVWLLLDGGILTGLRFEGASKIVPPDVLGAI